MPAMGKRMDTCSGVSMIKLVSIGRVDSELVVIERWRENRSFMILKSSYDFQPLD